MLTKLAVRYLTYRLRKNEGFWSDCQSSIAISIWNTYSKYHPIQTLEEYRKFCNESANKLLDIWTKRGKKC